VLLYMFHLLKNKGRRWNRERRTTIARTVPLPLLRSKETRFGFDFVPPSCLIHISAVMGPLVVWRVRFLRSLFGAMPGGGGGGDKVRSRMYCPFTGAPCFDMRR
jgi:hypothetical protein